MPTTPEGEQPPRARPAAGQREQLAKLTQPFPRRLIESKDGNSYVAHSTVNEWLLGIVGPFSFELVEILRGNLPATAPNPQGKSARAKAGTPALTSIVVGGVWRLTAEIDGRVVHVEEVGDVGDPHNRPHDGARLKDAASDALKRCAMRLGLGLHLWSGSSYALAERLRPELTRQDDGRPAAAPASRAPEGGEASPSPSSGSNGQGDLGRITSVARARAYVKGQPKPWQAAFRRLSAQARDTGELRALSELEGFQRLIARTDAHMAQATSGEAA